MPNAILFTQCLQGDFTANLGPQDPLPNLLHIGFEESRRLLGEDPKEGPVARFMGWAYRQPDSDLSLVHIRDWHDARDPEQKAHLDHFGSHCLKSTAGARFVFDEPAGHGKQIKIVESPGLNDFLGTDLAAHLAASSHPPARLGIIGVWTDVKVSFLAYELRTRFPGVPIGLCSALTASRSRTQHHLALERLHTILQIEVFHTVGGFADFLSGSATTVAPGKFADQLEITRDQPLAPGDEPVIRYLFRHSAKVSLHRLDGGFSGNTVLRAESEDPRGLVEAPHVVKIGPREPMGQERLAFEKVENVLGNHAPRIADFVELGDRGGIKYRYASMGGGKGSTFQKTWMGGAPMPEIKSILDQVFLEQLGSFAKAARSERVNVLSYYLFAAKWAPSIREKVAALDPAWRGDVVEILPGHPVDHPALFYEQTLARLADRPPDRIPWAMVHGDLNGANIILDGHKNVWLIDFFHTHMGHALKDLIKLENDVLYIFTPVEQEGDLKEAMAISRFLAAVEDLAAPLPEAPPVGVTRPALVRCWQTIRQLRSYWPELVGTDRGPYPARVAQLRYAMHTLGFDESSLLQKKWALYTGAILATALKQEAEDGQALRLDWVEIPGFEKGTLALTILPGRRDKHRHLSTDLAELKKQGITRVLSLLQQDEMDHFGVSDLLSSYDQAGLSCLHRPFLDQGVPSFEEMDGLIAWLEAGLASGQKTLVHCVGGLGRSGLVAACLLVHRGIDAREAVARVRRARSIRAVESELQERFLMDYGARHKARN